LKGRKKNRNSGIKDKFTSKCWEGTKTMVAVALSLAKEIRNATTSTNKACTNERSRENYCGNY